jgi:4-hydroxy-tetrahydrodipicolinate reductase
MSPQPLRVAIPGCAGRMGRALVQALAAADDMQLCGASEAAGSPALGQDAGSVAGLSPLGIAVTDDPQTLLADAQAVIDFSLPHVTADLCRRCAERGLPLVVGTTGLSAEQHAALQRAAERVPVVFAANMSVGVNVLLRLVEQAATLLGPGYDLEVVEAHHGRKVDAPSGTALALARALATATGQLGALEQRARHGRHGAVGARAPAEIGIHAVRGGDVVGEHTVLFLGEGERLELVHRASSRQTFARGALRALRWATARPAGLYDMRDVLGLR